MNGMETLLRPRSVAIVGASEHVDRIGGRPLHYLLRHGFAGPVYPVSQRHERVQGVLSYASLDALPQAPDCVILSVPAQAALEQVRACGRVGAKAAVLFSSGFAELGTHGRDAQLRLVEEARAAGLRLLGPNTIGSANFSCGAVLSFASIYQDFAPEDGPVAIVSQSGAVGASVYALLRDDGVGVRYVCATGNQADVDAVDCVRAILQDPHVRMVLLYVEEVRDRDALAAVLADAAARHVTVRVLASAQSASGVRMAHFHTGSRSFDGAALARVLDEHGCRRAASVPELATGVAPELSATAASAGPGEPAARIGVISNSGASCVLSADACDARGLQLARFGPATLETLNAILPPFSRSRNPIDLTAMLLADGGMLGQAVHAVLQDEGCDAVALSLLAVAGAGYDVPRFAADAAAAVRASRKPMAFSSPDGRVRRAFAAQGLAVFEDEHQAVAALSRQPVTSRAGAPS